MASFRPLFQPAMRKSPLAKSARSRFTCSSCRAGLCGILHEAAAICWCGRAPWWDLRSASRWWSWLAIGWFCCQSQTGAHRSRFTCVCFSIIRFINMTIYTFGLQFYQKTFPNYLVYVFLLFSFIFNLMVRNIWQLKKVSLTNFKLLNTLEETPV